MGKTLEALVDQVGGCGRYQFIMVSLLYVNSGLTAWTVLMMVFGALEPDWWCLDPSIHGDLNSSLRNGGNVSSFGSWAHGSSDGSLGNLSLSSFLKNASSDDGNSLGATDVLEGTALLGPDDPGFRSCRRGNGSEQTCERIVFASGANTVVSEFQLVCDKSWIPAMITAVQMAGGLLGSIVSGQLGDTVGRKKTLIMMSTLHSLFALIAAFSNTWQMFAVLRVFLGFTYVAIIVPTYAYLPEFIGTRYRGLLASVPFWGLGTIPLSLVVWALRDWRHLQIATGVCAAAILPAWM
ncbi:hypothetical protein BaRGS_00023413 [Batillaria attramentaria]|uniref:Major facilitator superfamily (MFS) profile domain-containing protein n=1 Tax=Batillaria attramentaria TaxID=370345 RepID=A0ABD0KDT5_9CAEN